MIAEKQKATVAAVALKNNQHTEDYRHSPIRSSNKRAEQIAERRAQIPRKYRAIYDRAVKGKGLRAAVDAQCLECVYYKSDEVRNCTDLACPLWAVRPYRISRNSQNEDFSGAESKKTGQGVNHAG